MSRFRIIKPHRHEGGYLGALAWDQVPVADVYEQDNGALSVTWCGPTLDKKLRRNIRGFLRAKFPTTRGKSIHFEGE